MQKNALLINPWIYDFSAYDYWIKPLGLLYMASYLRQNAVNVRFIDCLNPRSSPQRLDRHLNIPKRRPGGHGKFPKERIRSPEALHGIPKPYHRYGMSVPFFKDMLQQGPQPDLVLVTSMMTYWYPGAYEVIKLVKDHFPGIPVILGGNYATLCPDHARKSGADYLLTGAGEPHIPLIVKEILGLPLLFHPDLQYPDNLPYPAFDLLVQPDQVPILTSRGCPFRCPYCASHRLHRRFTRRDPSAVVQELTHWAKDLGITDFSFYDDALFTEPDKMAYPLMREIIDQGLAFRFHCPNGLHLREVTAELAKLMFRSGFKTLRFGFETSDHHRQLEMGGKANNSHFDQAVAYLVEAGYQGRDIGVYILCGLPGQKDAEISETIHYVRSRGARPILAEFSPIPQTDFWPAAVDASPFPLEEEPLFHNNSLLPCRDGGISLTRYQELKKMTR